MLKAEPAGFADLDKGYTRKGGTEDDCRVLARANGTMEFITVRKTGREQIWDRNTNSSFRTLQ